MTTEADTIADLARKSAGASIIQTSDGREWLITPGNQAQDVTDEHGLAKALPRYIEQAVTLQTAQSLVDYVNRYKSTDTVLFADIGADTVVAQLDYHAADKAAHVAHRATLTLQRSEEWKLWSGISGKLMQQLEFARFIEENAADVRAPDAGELLEAVCDLQANRKVNFTKAVRTSSDNENFEFTDETTATTKKGLELPTKFKLGLPVYFGESDTEVFAFLRWKLDDGKLLLGIQIHRMEHVRQAVFKQIVTALSEGTEATPAVFGKL